MNSPALDIKFSHVTNADGFDTSESAEPAAQFQIVEGGRSPNYHHLTLTQLYRELDDAVARQADGRPDGADRASMPLTAAFDRHINRTRADILLAALQTARPLLENAVRRWQKNRGFMQIDEEGPGRPAVSRPPGSQIRPR